MWKRENENKSKYNFLEGPIFLQFENLDNGSQRAILNSCGQKKNKMKMLITGSC